MNPSYPNSLQSINDQMLQKNCRLICQWPHTRSLEKMKPLTSSPKSSERVSSPMSPVEFQPAYGWDFLKTHWLQFKMQAGIDTSQQLSLRFINSSYHKFPTCIPATFRKESWEKKGQRNSPPFLTSLSSIALYSMFFKASSTPKPPKLTGWSTPTRAQVSAFDLQPVGSTGRTTYTISLYQKPPPKNKPTKS